MGLLKHSSRTATASRPTDTGFRYGVAALRKKHAELEGEIAQLRPDIAGNISAHPQNVKVAKLLKSGGNLSSQRGAYIPRRIRETLIRLGLACNKAPRKMLA